MCRVCFVGLYDNDVPEPVLEGRTAGVQWRQRGADTFRRLHGKDLGAGYVFR